MQLTAPTPVDHSPLTPVDAPVPTPGPGELLLRVRACGVCHTDLHIVEGDLPLPRLPIIPGHQIVGTVEALGEGASGWRTGERAGVAWLHRACGTCPRCRADAENLCDHAEFTGLHVNGGFAEYATVPAEFAYRIPPGYDDAHAAPLLCAGIVGYRALCRSRVQPGQRLGLYGFGASAHVAIQIARRWGCDVWVCTRSARHRALAERLGAAWTGRAEDLPPARLDAAVIFAPAGPLVREALRALDKGGTLSLGGIAMSPIPELDYVEHLYHERTVTSTAHATRDDGRRLLALAAEAPLTLTVEVFPLAEANAVLRRLKDSLLDASAALIPDAGRAQRV